jgi:hypothetical protein
MEAYLFIFGIPIGLAWDLLWRHSVPFLVPRFPSKSGLIHKHIVKHIVWILWGRCFSLSSLFPSKSGLIHKHFVKHTRPSPDHEASYSVIPARKHFVKHVNVLKRAPNIYRAPSLQDCDSAEAPRDLNVNYIFAPPIE